MPIYEYRCRECGDFEVLLGMGAATRESDCPGCGSAARRLRISLRRTRAR